MRHTHREVVHVHKVMTFECCVANSGEAKRFRFFGETLSPDFTLVPSTLSISSYKYDYISLITMDGLTSLNVNASVHFLFEISFWYKLL